MNPAQLTGELKKAAGRLGFDLVGACPAVAPTGAARFAEWLALGYAGEMQYLAGRQQAHADPNYVLQGARSILMLGMSYRTADPAKPKSGQGRVSRYAWGADYHELIRGRLNQLADQLRLWAPGAEARGVVDTAPLSEREFAQIAGLGWIGKNTLLLNMHAGSWFFLAALLTDLELDYDPPHATDHCGTCRACLDACPTDAFAAPYVLDARRCISYLTIELRTAIPRELRPAMGDWLFGCDVCQDVCPWNHRAPRSEEPGFEPQPGMNPVELAGLFDLEESAFRERFRHSPLWRPKRRGLLRNAAIVLGNQRPPNALPALIRGLHDAEPLVRGACAWAIGQYGTAMAAEALSRRLAAEPDAEVREEIDAALATQPVRQLESRCT